MTLPEAGDTVCITVELPEGATYANGGLGVSVPVDGVYYWANVQWEAKKSGTIELNLADNLLNVTYNDADGNPVEVEDEASSMLSRKHSASRNPFRGQVWYVDKGTNLQMLHITDAYVKAKVQKTPLNLRLKQQKPTEEPSE